MERTQREERPTSSASRAGAGPRRPDEWEATSRALPARDQRLAAQTVTFAQDELDAIRAAAARAGVRTSEYIRVAAVNRARRDSTGTARAI